MKYTRWTIGGYDENAASHLRSAGYPCLLSAVLASRGVSSPEAAVVFLDRERSLAHSPMLMKDMDRAVERINRAIADQERIAVFGDYDVDGITATVLLVDYLRSRGADCLKYIPRRVEDGYGLGRDALQSLRDKGVTLVVTVDCGITGVEEALFAQKIGLDLVITDHHECKDRLPVAAAVVDPRRPDCPYPFKHLAGVGVALKLVLALGAGREEALFARYCTLAAIGTVADVMQMTGENRTIVYRGLEAIGGTDFLGLRALLRETGLYDKEITSTQIGFVLAPRINAAGRMGEAELAADLLLTSDPEKADFLARQLCSLNRERQVVEQEIFAEAVERIELLPDRERSALVLSSDVWHQGVVGIVASRLSEKYSCPSFMIRLQNGMGKGSCRSYGGFNLFAALESCSDLLVDFGGHELAAGFNIREEDIPAFRRRINRCVRSYVGGAQPVSSLFIDAAVRPEDITLEEMEQLSRLEPYGAGNDRPVFALLGARLESIQSVGQNRHAKLRLSKGGYSFDAIFFSTTAAECGLAPGARVDAAFYLQINEFRGASSVQLQMVDLRPAEGPSARERECLELVHRLTDGEAAFTRREASRLLPDRCQFAALWRAIERAERDGWPSAGHVPTLRSLAGAVGGTEPFLRSALGLAVFAERELITLELREDMIIVHPRAGRRADLEQSVYVRVLRRILGQEEKGGR